MKINMQTPISFQRAFTTKEKTEYKAAMDEARKELGINETSAVIFDFNVPSEKGKNYGIGTLNSPNALKFADFLKGMAGISKIQAGPQSELAYSSSGKFYFPNKSPYSGTTFTLGRHTISLEKLAEDEYGNILDIKYAENADKNYPENKTDRSYRADYDYLIGWNQDGVLIKGLETAYNNMINKAKENNPKAQKFYNEFASFKENMSEDVKKDIVFDILANKYHKEGKKGTDIDSWSYTDKYLFTYKVSKDERRKRLKELESQGEILKFAQFIATKQHNESKANLNNKGIKLYGDCLVCFSPKEVWANPDCFKSDWYTGGIDPFCPETNGIQPWGSPALDYDKLGEFDENNNIKSLGETGKLLYRKFKNFMELYDGIRMDAFWQYVTPFIYNDKLEGKNIEGVNDKIIKIMEKAAIDTKGECDPNRFVLELIGFNTEKGKELTKNIYPHVYSTAYAEYNENPADLIKNQHYKDGYFTIGATSHDNDSLINMSRAKDRVECHTPILKRNLKEGYRHLSYESPEYKKQSQKERKEQDFRTAKIAEIFTTKNQYFTLPDMFGMAERINVSGKVDDSNWSVRIPENYEEFYYNQLSRGCGINFPKAYEIALYAKNSNNKKIIDKVHKFSEILASNGPMTTKEADKLEKSGKLNKSV